MKVYSSYKVKIKHYNNIFKQTVEIYRNAVSFFINVCDKEWDILEPLKNLERKSKIEKLTIQTKKIKILNIILMKIFIKCQLILDELPLEKL